MKTHFPYLAATTVTALVGAAASLVSAAQAPARAPGIALLFTQSPLVAPPALRVVGTAELAAAASGPSRPLADPVAACATPIHASVAMAPAPPGTLTGTLTGTLSSPAAVSAALGDAAGWMGEPAASTSPATRHDPSFPPTRVEPSDSVRRPAAAIVRTFDPAERPAGRLPASEGFYKGFGAGRRDFGFYAGFTTPR